MDNEVYRAEFFQCPFSTEMQNPCSRDIIEGFNWFVDQINEKVPWIKRRRGNIMYNLIDDYVFGKKLPYTMILNYLGKDKRWKNISPNEVFCGKSRIWDRTVGLSDQEALDNVTGIIKNDDMLFVRFDTVREGLIRSVLPNNGHFGLYDKRMNNFISFDVGYSCDEDGFFKRYHINLRRLVHFDRGDGYLGAGHMNVGCCMFIYVRQGERCYFVSGLSDGMNVKWDRSKQAEYTRNYLWGKEE